MMKANEPSSLPAITAFSLRQAYPTASWPAFRGYQRQEKLCFWFLPWHVWASSKFGGNFSVVHLMNELFGKLQVIPLIAFSREGHEKVADLGQSHAFVGILRMKEWFLALGDDRQHHLHGSSTLLETRCHDSDRFSMSPNPGLLSGNISDEASGYA